MMLWTCECGYESPVVRDHDKRYCICGRTVPRDPGKPEFGGEPMSIERALVLVILVVLVLVLLAYLL